ncbi:4-methyl-5(b-hydroxyethyl)-thiazole monophosphate biosynthesis [Microbulbifer donghaiensis]|uniref:4-methyl-5(B-hydroxyethyl)-thiazole monophosphate biosynthesis n=1 Tax=Microbulbifer donghaiensis TaxID=494016 RepID=A0A1M4ZY67_9GAMM|nr:DJ-1 family glyoxalase III [Microbulbifer donghaiensis]SHF22894.1 4-methyl-5(b-hydroxyethyl)-thiazole monophosphate biosynthesis [Microbulbifer donghaiensis]
MTRVLVPVADGSEEIEVVTIVDVLRRADAEVALASVMKTLRITASRGVIIEADCHIDSCVGIHWDLIALPGGMPGAEHLHTCAVLKDLLANQLSSGFWLGAICASPAVVLGRQGLISDYRATCHSAFVDELGAAVRELSDELVVRDRNLITSQAPGTAMNFALALVCCLFGEDTAQSVAEPMRATLN